MGWDGMGGGEESIVYPSTDLISNDINNDTRVSWKALPPL
jgi:hypothetical protein